MLEYELLSNAVYAYRNGAYEITDIIEPSESYCLFSYYEEPGDLFVKNTPFYEGYDDEIPNNGWEVWISVEQAGADFDEVVIGASDFSTDDYDFRYDLPEPPEKPFDEGLAMYFPQEGQNVAHEKLNQEYIYALATDAADEHLWNFVLDFTELGEITFDSALFDFPDDYNVYIIVEGMQANLSDGETLTILPEEGGTIEGEILVQNQYLSSEDVTVVRVELKNYPNPFNPDTNISFNIATESEVDLTIYNIKGQKVTTLVSGILAPNNYIFNWSGKDRNNNSVASGVYFYQLKTKKETFTKKMILLK